MKTVTVSRGGQISLPAAIRHRWKTNRVLLDDRGDIVVVRPLPSDPIDAARGMLHGPDQLMTSVEARRQTRDEEASAHRRKRR
jgi:bifunctional DNA-binding transcriptional regulator/antitoxin component of YhaV-PrlF toxin-antitoxin module